jgi:hypothetical protein
VVVLIAPPAGFSASFKDHFMPTMNELVADAMARAKAHGVNPYRAVGIMAREGLNPNTINSPTFGNRDAKGYSYGPWQLYSGSPQAGAVAPGGDAYEFQKRYGEAPSAKNWREQNEYAISTMARMGDNAAKKWYSVRDNGGWGNIEKIGQQYVAQNQLGPTPSETPMGVAMAQSGNAMDASRPMAYGSAQPGASTLNEGQGAIQGAFGSPGGGDASNPFGVGGTSSSPSGWDAAGNIGNGLMGAGAALMAIDNPQGAAAIAGTMRAMDRGQRENEWASSVHEGQVIRLNKRSGQVQVAPIPGYVKPAVTTPGIREYEYSKEHPEFAEEQKRREAEKNALLHPKIESEYTDDERQNFLNKELAGGKLGSQEFGTGKQGNAEKIAYNKWKVAQLKTLDLTEDDIQMASIDKRFKGKVADRLALAEQNTAMAGARIEAAAENVKIASEAYPRVNVQFIQGIKEKWDEQTNNPKLAAFKVAIDAYAKDYAQALNPSKTQVTVDDMKEARNRILTRMNGESTEAVLGQVRKEVLSLRANVVKMHEGFFGKKATLLPNAEPEGPPAPPPPPPGQPAPATPGGATGGGTPRRIRYDASGNRIQ